MKNQDSNHKTLYLVRKENIPSIGLLFKFDTITTLNQAKFHMLITDQSKNDWNKGLNKSIRQVEEA